MAGDKTINYKPTAEQQRQTEISEKSQMHSADFDSKINDSVEDYDFVSSAWDEHQNSKNINSLHTMKKNSSHDPEFR